MSFIASALMFIGLIISIGGSIWFLVVAFQESILWGIGCLIFGPVGLVFLILHFDEAAKPFFISLAGALLMAGGMFMSPEPFMMTPSEL